MAANRQGLCPAETDSPSLLTGTALGKGHSQQLHRLRAQAGLPLGQQCRLRRAHGRMCAAGCLQSAPDGSRARDRLVKYNDPTRACSLCSCRQPGDCGASGRASKLRCCASVDSCCRGTPTVPSTHCSGQWPLAPDWLHLLRLHAQAVSSWPSSAGCTERMAACAASSVRHASARLTQGCLRMQFLQLQLTHILH